MPVGTDPLQHSHNPSGGVGRQLKENPSFAWMLPEQRVEGLWPLLVPWTTFSVISRSRTD